MKYKITHSLVAVFAFAAGYSISSQIEKEDSLDSSAPPVVAETTDHPTVERKPAERAENLQQDTHPRPMTESEKAEAFRGYLMDQFSSTKRRFFHFQVFGEDGKIADSFATVYGLSSSDLDTLNSKINETKEEIYSLARNHTSISHGGDGSSTVVLEPFEGAEDAYSTILSSFENVLGEKGFADFLELGEPSVRDVLHQFGGERREVKIKPTTMEVTGKNGERTTKTSYHISDKKERTGKDQFEIITTLTEKQFSTQYSVFKQLLDESAPTP